METVSELAKPVSEMKLPPNGSEVRQFNPSDSDGVLEKRVQMIKRAKNGSEVEQPLKKEHLDVQQNEDGSNKKLKEDNKSKTNVHINYEVPVFITEPCPAQDLSAVYEDYTYEVVTDFLSTEATKSVTKFVPYKATLRRALPSKIHPASKKPKQKVLTHSNSVDFMSKEEFRARYKHTIRHPPLCPKDDSDAPHTNTLPSGKMCQPLIFSSENDSKLCAIFQNPNNHESDTHWKQQRTDLAVFHHSLKTKEELHRHRPPPPRPPPPRLISGTTLCQTKRNDCISAGSKAQEHASQEKQTFSTAKELSSSLPDCSATDTHLHQPLMNDSKVCVVLQNPDNYKSDTHCKQQRTKKTSCSSSYS